MFGGGGLTHDLSISKMSILLFKVLLILKNYNINLQTKQVFEIFTIYIAVWLHQ